MRTSCRQCLWQKLCHHPFLNMPQTGFYHDGCFAPTLLSSLAKPPLPLKGIPLIVSNLPPHFHSCHQHPVVHTDTGIQVPTQFKVFLVSGPAFPLGDEKVCVSWRTTSPSVSSHNLFWNFSANTPLCGFCCSHHGLRLFPQCTRHSCLES